MATSLVAMPALAQGPNTNAGQYGGGPPGQASDGPPGQNGGPPGHDRGDEAVAVPELEENSTLEAILAATERLNDLELEDDAETAAANETVAAINDSLTEYRRTQYADSRAAFEHLAAAQRSLDDLKTAVDDDDEAIVDEISERLYAASEGSARLTVTDAITTVATYEDEFRNPGQRQKAESALGNAIDASERADDTVSQTKPGRQSRGNERAVGPADRATATEHLENAWKHGERALDTVEATTEPTLSLSQGQAFERNETVQVSIQATLSDVRPYAYENATVNVNGDADVDDLSFISDESANSFASGTTLVDLGTEPENVTITVTATAAHDPDRTVEETLDIHITEDDVLWERPDPDEYQDVTVSDESSGVSVDVGGGGLHEADISVSDETPETDDAYRAGPMVRIENTTPIDEATVEIPLDEAALDREGNLSIVTWDPHGDEPWTPVETEIDADEGVATADVDHFSFFSVFWIDDWEDHTSDTITLDGDEVDDIGNGSEIEKADFTFVIDVSGSMSGDRIRNARLAAQQFVGAFTEDERGALVEFESSADLVEGLTTDHKQLNESIEGLSAGGLTNTGGGLQEGIAEFEDDGWENRSSVMILLADGHTNTGPDPVGVAEEAAEKGIEISTIGLGSGIDENELREIAGTTGGDFYQVDDADDLPETFERVAENQTGVDLTDSNGDGIPDLVAEMDLRMPTGEPGVVGEPLDLDRIALDTSGDGIQDNETVDINYRIFEEDNETKLYASVTYAASHPARVDTTGDGLTDAEQLEGWEINYTSSREDSLAVLEELEDADDFGDLDDLGGVFESPTVYANPLVNDTSGDGLSDLEEVQRLRTDPESTDTTGDGVPDAESPDPTLFDISSPEITLIDTELDDLSVGVDVEVETTWKVIPTSVDVDGELDLSNSYEVEFVATDPAGLSEARLYQNSDQKDRTSLSGTRDHAALEFETGLLSSLSDFFVGGVLVTLEVDDRHETIGRVGTTEVEAIEVNSISGELSEELRSSGVTSARAEEGLGFLGGMTTGAGETLGALLEIYDDPWVIIHTLQEIPDAIENLDEIIAALPDAIEESQDNNNPHDPGDRYYDDYRQGWYQGYVSWFVVEMVVPAGEAGKALKSSDRLQSTVNGIDTPETPRITEAINAANRASETATAPIRYTQTQFSRGLAASLGLTRDVSERILSPVPTTGGQYQVGKTLDRNDVDGSELATRSADEQRQIGEFTARYGDEGARLHRVEVCNSPCESIVQLFHRTDHLDTATQGWLIRAYDDGTISNDDLRRIAQGLENGNIDQAAVQQALVRANHLETRGHDVVELQTAASANQRYMDRGDQPPHKAGTMVVEYEAQIPERFVRVYDSESGPSGAWIMKEREFSDLSSPGDVKDRFGLSDEWANYDSVAEVTIGSGENQGVQMQMSTASPIEDTATGVTRPGGGTQHYAPDDIIEGFEPIGDLSEFLGST